MRHCKDDIGIRSGFAFYQMIRENYTYLVARYLSLPRINLIPV